MLADDMQRDEARGRRLPTDEEVTKSAGYVLADAIARHGADDKDAIISELMGELIAMTRALRDAQEEIRQADESTGKIIALLTQATNIANRKD